MFKVIKKANEQDIDRLKDFLEKAEISQDGIEENTIESFLLLENEEGRLEASIGIEKLGQCGLLRSLVITPSLGQKELLKLFQQVGLLAVEKNIKELYLVTNKPSSLEFFHLLGFETAEKDTLSNELRQSDHLLQSIEMENTVFMKKVFN